MVAEFAVASDLNPGTVGKNDNVFHPNNGSVLFGDGHVEFCQNPFVGINRDHIFANKKKQVVASPVDTTDSVLLPTDD